jgi:hypothetical protein
VGSFGAVFDLNEALAFIADDPAFWIRAKGCASAWKSRPVSGVIGVQNPTTS